MGTFDIFFHAGSLWRRHRSVISFIVSENIFAFHTSWGSVLKPIYKSTIGTKYLDGYGTGVKPKHISQNH